MHPGMCPCVPLPLWWSFVSLARARMGFRGGGGSCTCLGILRDKGLEDGPRERASRMQLQRHGGLAWLLEAADA